MRKQRLEHEDFLRLRAEAAELPPAHVDRLIETGVRRIRSAVAGRAAAFAWSGGKDSVALRVIAEEAGIRECLLGMCDLEYPAFLRWVTDYMPERLEVVNTGLDLDWLVANPVMLFPKDAATAAMWFKSVQHAAQAQYFRRHKLSAIILGRRVEDGNFVGRGAGVYSYTSNAITRVSPIYDWTHQDVFAVIDRYRLPLPPFYDWPRGFRCGTHAWPARQWCRDEEHGWQEIFAIDPAVVRYAAGRLESAARFLDRDNRSGEDGESEDQARPRAGDGGRPGAQN